jgi:protein-disulfide isomerase
MTPTTSSGTMSGPPFPYQFRIVRMFADALAQKLCLLGGATDVVVRMFLTMKRLLTLVLLVAGCRPSDGGAKSPPAQGASASVAAPASAASPAAQSKADSARDNALLERADRSRIQGDTAAPVWIVEISDFECPFCKQWHDSTYPAIVREFIRPGIARLAYVNFPLAQHPHALPAAEAAMCAGAQDRFWPMHDAIFNAQSRWVPLTDAMPMYDSLAVSLGVNATQWRDCVRSNVMRRLINADRARGTTAGVGSTPTFFVGDEPIRGAAPIDAFRAAIARARTKAAARSPQ